MPHYLSSGQLREFAAEVTRVALEVGTKGVLGGQAQVDGVEGTWRSLTDNVNVSYADSKYDCNYAKATIAPANGLESHEPSPIYRFRY